MTHQEKQQAIIEKLREPEFEIQVKGVLPNFFIDPDCNDDEYSLQRHTITN